REHMREDEWRLTIVFDTALPAGSSSSARAAANSNKRSGQPAEESSSTSTQADLDDFRERFERAVLMAASLANHFILERAEVELITTSDQHNVPSSSGQEHLYKLLAALATLQPTEPPDEGDEIDKKRPRRGWSFFGRA